MTLVERLRTSTADIRAEYLDPSHTYPWIIGYSGGKDSTLVLQLVFETIMSLAPSDRTRQVHVLANDTLVESPILSSYVDAMLQRVRDAADAFRLPMKVVKTTPAIDQTFWVNLIGRGYPPPNRMFRWCTDRMKIRPTSEYIQSQVSALGQAILLLGVRRSESAVRAASVGRYDPTDGTRLNPHNTLKGCLVFRPIVELTTDEVWQALLQKPPTWGGTHRELVTLYKNAGGGECPLVLDKEDAPSCGTSSSRLGCWTCTVVEKDRSMGGFIEAGFSYLEPLMYFRDWLSAIRGDRSRRMKERRNGLVTLMADGSLVPGPFTMETRKVILDKLLAVQVEVGVPLISEAEIEQIHHIWTSDIARAGHQALGIVSRASERQQ